MTAKFLFTTLFLVYLQLLVSLVEVCDSKFYLQEEINKYVTTYKKANNEHVIVNKCMRKRLPFKNIKKMFTSEETKVKKTAKDLLNVSLVHQTVIFHKVKVRSIKQKHSGSVATEPHHLLHNQVNLNAEVEISKNISIFLSEKKIEYGFKRTWPEENPYAVMIHVEWYGDTRSVCSGSLVTKSNVLTSASCLKGPFKGIVVYAGGNSLEELENQPPTTGQVKTSKSVILHPKFDEKKPLKYNVGIVYLPKPFELTRYVNTVGMLSRNWTLDRYKACTITGFGVGKTNSLDYARKTHNLEVKSPCVCLEEFDEIDKFVCSKPKKDFGICNGDQGGGLVCDGKVVAVAIGYLMFDDFTSCDLVENYLCRTENTISEFIEINQHLEWINSMTMNDGPFTLPSYLLITSTICIIL